ncbi:uncharacterized protein LOC111586651 [Amphiprion ocellaris]|uniref:uncharacterized protein LOC111586651 n=1 Tax=Amphiprion ocellaris TaxID=80972 RepID=UPI000C302588|nr:uncharacterized protein LOC111586651 [Amphiprion ocellaris]XP_035797993.1 uncharacterized protein LOC111586651 [Amphiprion ocellaris]
MDPQQVAPYSRRRGHPVESYRVPDSDQVPVPASFKFQELMSLKVPPELHNAAETLWKYYPVRDNDPNIKEFFRTLGKAFKESDSAQSSKTSSSHAGTVKIHKIVTGKTFGADEALLKHLNCKELQVKMTDRQGCDIIILFCPITSRVGSDVELAMTKVSGEERVILILMHHTRDVDYSTAAKRWSETFSNVVFDVSVLYHETVPGLLKCLKNMEAISGIRKELMQYSSSMVQYSSRTNQSFLRKQWERYRPW